MAYVDRGRALGGNRPLFAPAKAAKFFPKPVTQPTGPVFAFLLESGDGAFNVETGAAQFGREQQS